MRSRTSASRCSFHLSCPKASNIGFTFKHLNFRNHSCRMPLCPRWNHLLWPRGHGSCEGPVPKSLADCRRSNTRVDQLCWHSKESKMRRVCGKHVGWGYLHHTMTSFHPGPSHILQVLQINLKSIFLLSQAAGQHMVPLRRGKIINFCSLLTFQGGLTVPAYAAAKGGLGQLTKAMANEWSKENVQVNAIVPGYIKTDM